MAYTFIKDFLGHFMMGYAHRAGQKLWLIFMMAVLLFLYQIGLGRQMIEGVSEYVLKKDVPKKVALTFDDGPHPVYTPKLLEGLKNRGVIATFFVTGENALLYPELIEQMKEEGHIVGNHTYHHVQLSAVGEEIFIQELEETNRVLEGILEEEIIYVRPPFGEWTKSIEQEINMLPVLWDVDPLDWCSGNVDQIVNKIIKNVEENDIILLHDEYQSSVDAALRVIDTLLEEGYEFVTVEEILCD